MGSRDEASLTWAQNGLKKTEVSSEMPNQVYQAPGLSSLPRVSVGSQDPEGPWKSSAQIESLWQGVCMLTGPSGDGPGEDSPCALAWASPQPARPCPSSSAWEDAVFSPQSRVQMSPCCMQEGSSPTRHNGTAL